MRDLAQPRQQPVQLLVVDGERVAARQQHVAHLGMRVQIGERLLPLADAEMVLAARLADHARAGAIAAIGRAETGGEERSEEHTSELQSLMRISYAVFCLKKKNNKTQRYDTIIEYEKNVIQ